ncbi:hypothetical protein [Streptomyces mirabilis]|uniref:hypothetical protein n=1 Tax=Streptomyces mirabilis TaxID=68239 RepID=UPI0033F23494
MSTSHRVTTPGGGNTKVTVLLERVAKRAWMRLRTGHGTKGERLYDWAMIDVMADDTPPGQATGHSQVLVRRHRRTGTLSFDQSRDLHGCFIGTRRAATRKRAQ